MLRNPVVEPLRDIGARATAVASPPATGAFALFGSAIDDARTAGLHEGRAVERREIETKVAALSESITVSVVRAGQERRRLRDEQATELIGAAMEIAELLVGCIPPAEVAEALAVRVADALADIDDGPLSVAVAEEDFEIVEAAMGDEDVEVVVDRRLRSGETHVRGPWASIDITRSIVLDAVREALA